MARDAFLERLRTDGQNAQGNWIGMTPVGPFPALAPGTTLTVTFAARRRAQAASNSRARPASEIDTEESRDLLRNNVFWAQQTYAGEDPNYNGALDAGEDVNGNGVLDRYLIPEPPRSPRAPRRDRAGPCHPLLGRLRRGAASTPSPDASDFEGYRIYRSDPGDDLDGNIFGQAALIAQYDRPGNDSASTTASRPSASPSP